MRIVGSLLKSSVVAALVFAFAWVRLSSLGSSFSTALNAFFGFGVLIVMFALAVGFPLVLLVERRRLGGKRSYTAAAATVGALFGALFIPDKTGNPFAVTFSPWTRDHPGFVGSIPVSWADYWGSITFLALVGASLGFAFWCFYSRGSRPNKRLERP